MRTKAVHVRDHHNTNGIACETNGSLTFSSSFRHAEVTCKACHVLLNGCECGCPGCVARRGGEPAPARKPSNTTYRGIDNWNPGVQGYVVMDIDSCEIVAEIRYDWGQSRLGGDPEQKEYMLSMRDAFGGVWHTIGILATRCPSLEHNRGAGRLRLESRCDCR